MRPSVQRISTNVLALICLVLLFLIFTQRHPLNLSFISSDMLQNFKTLFLSIILEALPFVLLGVLVSAVLQMFVSEQTIRKLVPKNPVLGILFACVVGIIFPLCECGMIPVIRRLLRKGMPLYVAIVFILVGPIINPVVYASTFMAFRSRPEIAYSRMALAFIVALVMGLLIYRFFKTNQLRSPGSMNPSLPIHGQKPNHHDHAHDNDHVHSHHDHSHDHGHAHSHHDHAHDHDHAHSHHDHSHDHDHAHSHHDHSHDHDHAHSHHDHSHGRTGIAGKLFGILGHASDEFFDMGKYLIFGAFITAVIQTVVDRESLISIGQGPIASHLFMMGFSFILSLCSTSDAFVASSFGTTFTTGSLLTFLVFGPMLDIKSLLMLLSTFRSRFVIALSALVFAVVLVCSLLFERIFLT
ncbi:permease [Paenibacillus piri]|uniref:Permease n=1 Tax=Paenibacillus piri TaxID=2547395 RepID=A0A4R5KUC6_9BACL|nr:permease [Paenibacillus piri]TDF98645.1 permease [Paenibacillus piri]